MADVVLVRAAVPVIQAEQVGLVFSTAAIAAADDLILDEVPAPAEQTILTTPAVAATDLATISDGTMIGQKVTLLVANGNTLGLPLAVTNVDSTADLDATKDVPLTIVWNGTNWQKST